MNFDSSVAAAQKYYPNLKIQYKDESTLMKLIGKVLFFNQSFSTYITTFGSTIYFPSRDHVSKEPDDSVAVLCHELAHMYSSQKKTAIVYSLGYLFPQVLVFLAVPTFIFFTFFKSLLWLLVLLPLPAYFRTQEEKAGYTIGLYVRNKINVTRNQQVFDLDKIKNENVQEFYGPSYYFMWYLPGLTTFFDSMLSQIRNGEKPQYDAALYEMVDDVVGE